MRQTGPYPILHASRRCVDAAGSARSFSRMGCLSSNRKLGHDLRLCWPTSWARLSWPLLLFAVVACDRGNSVTVSGDIPGLDTLGYRGDSLLAQAGRPPADLIASAQGAPVGTVDSTIARGTRAASGDAPAMTAGEAMSLRAQARGDSMARARAPQRAGGNDPSGRTRADSVRGVVTLVGVEPARRVVLRVGGNDVSLSGMATAGLRRVAGTEVMVRGVKITPRDIVVSDYLVRASGGVPTWDGILERGGALRLTDGSGRKRLPSVPVELRGMVGARVWVAFKNGSATADSYGVISRR